MGHQRARNADAVFASGMACWCWCAAHIMADGSVCNCQGVEWHRTREHLQRRLGVSLLYPSRATSREANQPRNDYLVNNLSRLFLTAQMRPRADLLPRRHGVGEDYFFCLA
jgi:hypothetical protein